MYCLGDGQGNGGNPGVNKTKIEIKIQIPMTTVLSGHAIENIVVSATTQNGTPIGQTWFTFEVTKGALSNYYGTAFANGTYPLSYIAPQVEKEIIITLKAEASHFSYLNGTRSVNITIQPLETPGPDPNEEGKEEGLFDEMLKPKYFFFWVIIIVLIIMTVIIFGFLLRTRRRLQRLENGFDLEEETIDREKGRDTRKSKGKARVLELEQEKANNRGVYDGQKNIGKSRTAVTKATVKDIKDPRVPEPKSKAKTKIK
jgi:hypothetical protein